MTKLFHIPVLLQETLDVLITEDTRSFFDGTLGLGGHAENILSSFPQIEKYIATDLDSEHLTYATNRLEQWKEKLDFHHSNFSAVGSLISEDTPRNLSILLDLGICSHHVDDAERGFAYASNGPLDMRFDTSSGESVMTLLTHVSHDELSDMFQDYGEEPQSYKIARRILERQATEPITETIALREAIESAVHPKDRKKCVVRCFQALRIVVNDELGHLEKALQDGFDAMKSGDRMGVMSYHSLEDRIVKKFFKKICKPITMETERSLHDIVSPAQAKMVHKKALVPTADEISENPRARSAKYRIIEKI